MILEIIVSILYLTNKIFLLLGKKSGWTIGIIASGLASVYFFILKFYLFFSLELACLSIMIFGFLGSKNTKLISYIVYTIIVIVMVILMINIEESGFLEFSTSILFMGAFLLLAQNRWHYGWAALGLAHFLMILVLQGKNQYFFTTMQALSVCVCILALLKTLPYSKRILRKRVQLSNREKV